MAILSRTRFLLYLSVFSLALLYAFCLGAGPTEAKLQVADVPTFRLRARVLSVGGLQPSGKRFKFRFSVPSTVVEAVGGAWSDWLGFEAEQVSATFQRSPAASKGFPVVVRLQVDGVIDPTLVEAEVRLDEGPAEFSLQGELFGPSLGILLWRDESAKARVGTMADYNQRYWAPLAGIELTDAQRPKRFPIVDRFIGGDDDRRDWRDGIRMLSHIGLTAVMLPPSRPIRDLLLEAGMHRTAWGVYGPPGYAFDYDPKVTPGAIAAWAQKLAKGYRDAGYAPDDMALFAMSDEPGWYYPATFGPLVSSPAALARFQAYVRSRGLQPGDIGEAGWDSVLPLGRRLAFRDLPSRRLFYWTMRFFSWDSSQHFGRCTRALEGAFYQNMPIFTNWNFFSGRFYVPGPVGNNGDKENPGAAMGGHDWFEFGKLRGGTALWTEDWFPDNQAYQWSFYCSKLRCAAEKSGVQFGGYVVPRAAGDRTDGLLQKILCLVGSGGKAVFEYVFGPEYNFPGNCYSERLQTLPKMAEAHGMIGRAEDLLWPGKRPRSKVAILMPRSSEVWDAENIPIPTQIADATNNNLNGHTVDYMAEVFDLYLALQHSNIPVDFVDEDDLSGEALGHYRVLYVTEPNIPAEGQRGLVEWVRSGGTLVTVSGAGARDRYDELSHILGDATGVEEQPRERLLVQGNHPLPGVGKGHGAEGDFTAVGVRGTMTTAQGQVDATFEDGSSAVVHHDVGHGRLVHFAWMPGLSYVQSATWLKGHFPAGFSEGIRRWIVHPTQLAHVCSPVTVDHSMIETPLLLSPGGAAVTLLNWTDQAVDRLGLTVRVPFAVHTIESVKHGRLSFTKSGDSIVCSLPLGAADIVMLRP